MTSEQQNLGKSNNESEVGVNDTLLPKKVPENWEVCKIQDILERVSSRVEPSEMDSQNYISLKHMGKGEPRIKDYGDASEVSSQKYEFSSGDILFGKLRPYFRKVALARSDGICSTDINVVKPIESVDRDFLFYTLFRQDFIDIADKTSTGTRMPRADWQKLDDLKIALPPAQEQKKISRLLYQIDSKIEANNRINELLEEIAQALFKSWFVDFEQFNHFKKSEVGKIPTCFEVMNLRDIADVTYGYSFSSEKFNEDKKGMPIIRIRNISDDTVDKYSPESFDDEYLVQPGDVLAGMDGEFRSHIWKGPKAGLNQRVCKFEGKDSLYSEIYLWNAVKSPLYKLEKSKTGTTVIHLGKRDIDDIILAVPDRDSLSQFNSALDPIYQEMINLRQENRDLKNLRETLLPKLMSGEIRVNDVELDELELDSEV